MWHRECALSSRGVRDDAFPALTRSRAHAVCAGIAPIGAGTSASHQRRPACGCVNDSRSPIAGVAKDAPLRDQLLELMLEKVAQLSDDSFLDLARVALAAVIHSPERAQDLVAQLGQKESGVLGWIRAAQKHGRMKPGDAVLAAHQLESLIKGMAFWPQVTMGQPKLTPRAQHQVAGAAVDLFLSHYAA